MLCRGPRLGAWAGAYRHLSDSPTCLNHNLPPEKAQGKNRGSIRNLSETRSRRGAASPWPAFPEAVSKRTVHRRSGDSGGFELKSPKAERDKSLMAIKF